MQTIFFVYVLVTLSVTSTESLLGLDEECLMLFQFKQSILHQDYASFSAHGFHKFASWKLTSNASNSGSYCCLWDGVTCSNEEEEGHVTGLDLSECFLRGSINSSRALFSLVHLQSLNLAMNDFAETQIPPEIGRLKQLRSLNLSTSRFSGQIPSEISQLMQLSSLDLSFNPNLRSPSLNNLLQNLTQLEELNLSRVDFSSSVPYFLANFSSLRSIYLVDCQLQDEFPTAIFHLPKLKILDISENANLTGFLPEFQNSSLLEHLDLDNTSFYGNIPESIGNLKHLVTLSVYDCFFSGRIPSSLTNMTRLTYLDVSYNEFIGVVPSLASLSELTVLDFSWNNFERGRVPDWLAKLAKLHELYASAVNIYGKIPPFLANLTQLRVVVLRSNELEGSITSSFSNLKHLRRLSLRNNSFSGKVDWDKFVGLNKLEDLMLDENGLTFVATNNYTNGTLPQLKNLSLQSCNLKKFPSFLRFQHRLTNLILNHNEIDGLIPVWIWNNSQETLNSIYLSTNFITGFDKHPHFLPWVRLETLDLSNNKLQGWLPVPPQTTIIYDASNNNLIGEIPPLICEVKSLQLLDLSTNNMTGNLPPCLGDLSNSLLLLNLNQNNFHGTMMNAFTHGCMLKEIDLSANRFQGQVPKSLANCTNLEILSLGDNSFDDVFPFWLGMLAKLQVLLLRSNKFHGPIHGPTTVSSHFPRLRIIDISNNHFSGQLPHKYFQTWNAMKSVYIGKSSRMQQEIFTSSGPTLVSYYSMTLTIKGVKIEYVHILNIFIAIDLSSNKFEGEIPQSLQNLQGLESLNLSNNRLTGYVLPSLGNLKNLESLDLSQNELSGEIPQQLLQLSFLAVFNVSFNHLHGRIPQGRQFNTFENSSYKGNLGLCGEPLSKQCQNSKASTPPPKSNNFESFLPSGRVDWIVICLGVGTGLVVGMVVGDNLTTRCSEWLIEGFAKRKDRWIRPLGKRRRRI